MIIPSIYFTFLLDRLLKDSLSFYTKKIQYNQALLLNLTAIFLTSWKDFLKLLYLLQKKHNNCKLKHFVIETKHDFSMTLFPCTGPTSFLIDLVNCI